MDTLRKFLEKCNIDAEIRYDEPMSAHTTFRIGGPADAFVMPRDPGSLASLLEHARAEGVPAAVIGGGANLLVADTGVRGIVACTSLLRETRLESGQLDGESVIFAGAGVPVTELTMFALDRGLSGLEFAAGLPGSVGGACYMNARCYEREFADVLSRVECLAMAADACQSLSVDIDRDSWAYKKTPFMPEGVLAGAVITGSGFRLVTGDRPAIAARMAELEEDRRKKGHFDWPSAGSLFKNDRRFGRPSGMLLDELGFRGRRVGDAMVSPKHANIFVNAGKATAADMMNLIDEARSAVLKAFGFPLEAEVVFLGEFGDARDD